MIEHVAEAVTPDTGLDAQVSNWACHGDDLVYVDVTTPLLRDAGGRDRLDTEMFLASLPGAVRPIVRRFFLQGILDPYYAWRSAALDLLANLYKEGLPEWVAPGVRAANERLGTDLDVDEVRRLLPQRSPTLGRTPTHAARRPFVATARPPSHVSVPAPGADRPPDLIDHRSGTSDAGQSVGRLSASSSRRIFEQFVFEIRFGLDVEPWEPLEPAGEPPVAIAEQLHRRGNEHDPHQGRVDEDRRRESEAEQLHDDAALRTQSLRTP